MLRNNTPAGAQTAQRDRVSFAVGLVILAAAAYLATEEIFFKPQTLPGYDLGTYLAAAHRILAGAPLYGYDPAGFVLGPYGQFLYPPPVALLFVPLALLPVGLAVSLWLFVLGCIAVALGVSITAPLVPAQRPWALALFLFFQPMLWDIRLGNTALLTTALCWLCWRSRERPARAGALFAAALGLKLLPALLVPYFLVAGRWRLLLWSALFGLVAVVVTLPLTGLTAWGDYLALARVIATASPAAGPNVLPAPLGTGVGRVAMLVLIVGVAIAAGRIGRSRPAATRSFALALAAAPLFASTVWYPYLTLALPALMLVGIPDPLPVVPVVQAGGHRMGLAAAAGRVVVWGVIGAQLLRQPDRDFILPLIGAFGLLIWSFSSAGLSASGARWTRGPATR